MRFDIFTSSIHCFSINDENLRSELETYALNEESKNSGRKISNVGGFQTDMFNKEFVSYYKFCQKNLPNIFTELKNTYKMNTNVIQPLSGWLNVNRKGNYNLHHRHGKSSDFSLVYYVKVPKGDSGQIVFDNPDVIQHLNEFDVTEYNQYNQARYKFKPKQNDLIIFPAHLQHFVEQNKTDEARISLAFNVKIG